MNEKQKKQKLNQLDLALKDIKKSKVEKISFDKFKKRLSKFTNKDLNS